MRGGSAGEEETAAGERDYDRGEGQLLTVLFRQLWERTNVSPRERRESRRESWTPSPERVRAVPSRPRRAVS